MCTIGAVSTVNANGERVVYLLKNFDWGAYPAACTQFYNPAGHDFLALVTTRQAAVNSGINAAGLAVMLAFSDYRLRTLYPPPSANGQSSDTRSLTLTGDFRTMANGVVLSECTTVDEAIAFFEDFVPRYPEMPGGNHLLADAAGDLAVVEHCAGKMRVEVRRGEGSLARANNSHLLIGAQQAQMYPDRYEDSRQRNAVMEAAVARWSRDLATGLDEEALLAEAKTVLSTHVSAAENQTGALCKHEKLDPNTGYTLSTYVSMVVNVQSRRMYYTIGNPCENEWQHIDLRRVPAQQRPLAAAAMVSRPA